LRRPAPRHLPRPTTPRPEPQPRPRLRDDSGVVAIEFALVLPFILIFLFLITDFGRFFNYVNDANQLAADGARMAAVNTYPGAAELRSRADTSELRNASGGAHLPDGLSICVDFPAGTSNVGDPVRVRTTGTFKLVPFLGDRIPVDTVQIHGEATMRLERPPSYAAGC
jgi:Flp pilus assembly protein TadG